MKRIFFYSLIVLTLSSCVTGMQRQRGNKATPEAELASSYYRQGGQEPEAMRDDEAPKDLPEPRKKVFVFHFWNDTPVQSDELGVYTADLIRKQLYESGDILVPSESTEMPDTKQFVSGSKVKVAQLVREGRKQGAAMVVIGRITNAQYRHKGEDIGILRQAKSSMLVEIEMKIFDVGSGREIFSSTHKGQAQSKSFIALEESSTTPEYKVELAKEAIKEAINPFAGEIVANASKLQWNGRIIRIAGHKVFINSGRASGVMPGDILRVLTVGEDLYEPGSDSYIGRSEGKLKGTLEVKEYVGEDGAVATVHSGGQFQEGDSVRLY